MRACVRACVRVCVRAGVRACRCACLQVCILVCVIDVNKGSSITEKSACVRCQQVMTCGVCSVTELCYVAAEQDAAKKAHEEALAELSRERDQVGGVIMSWVE